MFSSAQRSAPQSTSHLANARGYGSTSKAVPGLFAAGTLGAHRSAAATLHANFAPSLPAVRPASQPARYIVRDLALARKGDLTAIKTSKVVSATVVTKP